MPAAAWPFKYTGTSGKSGANDASAEQMGYLTRMMDAAGTIGTRSMEDGSTWSSPTPTRPGWTSAQPRV